MSMELFQWLEKSKRKKVKFSSITLLVILHCKVLGSTERNNKKVDVLKKLLEQVSKKLY